DAPVEVLPLLDKAYRYDASDNLIAEVLTQTQRRGMTNAANDESAHLERIIGCFNDLPHTGKSYSGRNRYGYDLNEQLQAVQQCDSVEVDGAAVSCRATQPVPGVGNDGTAGKSRAS
ncbi:hypothetical protein, partial [Pseudomonas sp. NPDC012596]|uniref:hypothetical protein n=1 Tax=Pseudomonas sp. NPDC012596 TaxID=3364419 RepID=UPI003698650A